MVKTAHYIEWHSEQKASLEVQIAQVMKHWQSRYELGSAVIVCKDPVAAVKLVEKQWRKLARQAQKHRAGKAGAEDILQITRTISRMQRVKFSSKTPAEDPDAKCFVVSLDKLTSLPSHCFTLYTLGELPPLPLLKILPADALVVAYGEKTELPGIHSKSVLEEKIQTEEAELLKWLQQHSIHLETLQENIESTNEALDTLLGSNALQTEFLHHTKQYLQLIQLAQPVTLFAAQRDRLKALEQLQRHVQLLSPAFLTDHILDSQTDDAFLLRDFTTKNTLTFEALRAFIAKQYQQGHRHLARALEQKAGFISI